MRIDVYADINQLTNVGEMFILLDRISNIDFRIPLLGNHPGNTHRGSGAKKKLQTQLGSYQIIREKGAFPFSLRKLSRADLPYRELKLTHEVISEELSAACNLKLYIKLTPLQYLRINYNSKKLFWQSQDFRSKISQSIIQYLVPLILCGTGTWFFLWRDKKPAINELKPNASQSKDKPGMKKENDKKTYVIPDSIP